MGGHSTITTFYIFDLMLKAYDHSRPEHAALKHCR
jgi:hypothetical protein